jgi:hypothetical protein
LYLFVFFLLYILLLPVYIRAFSFDGFKLSSY